MMDEFFFVIRRLWNLTTRECLCVLQGHSVSLETENECGVFVCVSCHMWHWKM